MMTDNGNTQNLSKQARFTDADAQEVFFNLIGWGRTLADDEPEYGASTSRKRDRWLREYAKKDPNLQGVLNAVVTIDKNRGWRLVGGRNQVAMFTRMFHEFQASPGLFGWRPSIAMQSLSFWSSDVGSVTELGREGRDGPVRALYTVDPGQCELTGSNRYPLKHYNSKNKANRWRAKDFIRVASMIDTDETSNGLGYCAVSRALELTKLMVAIHTHDMEELGARAPRGLLLLSGISQEQWTQAMAAREAELDGEGYKYFQAVAVLASRLSTVDAKLVAISQLPKGFDLKKWMDTLMYGYALCFGYDPSEFWPVQFGALGRGEEGSLQHEKATGKGRLDFVLGFQEQLQEFLPDSLEFLFEQRDDQGQLLRAEVQRQWIQNVRELYEAGFQYGGESLIDKAEARVLLADYGILPRSWAPTDSDSETDLGDLDTEPSPPTAEDMRERSSSKQVKRLRDELKARPYVWRCAEKYPDEPIVQYSYPSDTMTMVWERADEILKPGLWSFA